jgi:Glu-tRNA(Gln) amidotransferase subunit E-like FAD-binding protein
MLVQRFKAFRRAQLAIDRVPDALVFDVFRAFAEQRLSRTGVRKTLEHLAAQARTKSPTELRLPASLTTGGRGLIHDGQLTQAIATELARLDDARFADPHKKCRYLIGLLMQQYVGLVDGGELARQVRAALQLQPKPQLETNA